MLRAVVACTSCAVFGLRRGGRALGADSLALASGLQFVCGFLAGRGWPAIRLRFSLAATRGLQFVCGFRAAGEGEGSSRILWSLPSPSLLRAPIPTPKGKPLLRTVGVGLGAVVGGWCVIPLRALN